MHEFQLHTFSVDLIFAAKKKNQDYEILECQAMEFQPVKPMKQSPKNNPVCLQKKILIGILLLFEITYYIIISFFTKHTNTFGGGHLNAQTKPRIFTVVIISISTQQQDSTNFCQTKCKYA